MLNYQFLLVTESKSIWHERLLKLLTPLGQINVLAPKEAANHITSNIPNLIIIDSYIVDDIPRFITSLKNKFHGLYFVALDNGETLPDKVLAVFHAGKGSLIDYIPLTATDTELRKIFTDIKTNTYAEHKEVV